MVYAEIDGAKIGSRIKGMRYERGETAEDLAKSIGVSPSAIAMYEIGQRIPRDEIKIKIAEHCGLPVEDIFFTPA